jgi:hypothetical protein
MKSFIGNMMIFMPWFVIKTTAFYLSVISQEFYVPA